MALQTWKGATQLFTITLPIPAGTSITTDHTVIWMVKLSPEDNDEAAVLTKRLSDGTLVIQDDGLQDGQAKLRGTLTSDQTYTLFVNHYSGKEAHFQTEVRVITPPPDNRVQPRVFTPLTIRDTLIDQRVHDSELE